MAQKQIVRMTVPEFFAWQETQDDLHELVDGVPMRMMSGAKNRHDQITVNIIAALHARLRGKACHPTTQDTAIRISETQVRRPDVMIDCGPRIDDSYIANNPRAVFEVLSPSTRMFDSAKKLAEYMSVATLQHILLIDTNNAEILSYFRHDDQRWDSRTITGLDAALEFEDISLTLPLSEVFLDVSFRPKPVLIMPDEP